MFYCTVVSVIVKYFVERDRIHVIKNKSDVSVMFGVFILCCNKSNVFGRPTVEGPCVTLVRKINFVVGVILQNKTHIFAKKELVLNTVSVWNYKYAFGNFFFIFFHFGCYYILQVFILHFTTHTFYKWYKWYKLFIDYTFLR